MLERVLDLFAWVLKSRVDNSSAQEGALLSSLSGPSGPKGTTRKSGDTE